MLLFFYPFFTRQGSPRALRAAISEDPRSLAQLTSRQKSENCSFASQLMAAASIRFFFFRSLAQFASPPFFLPAFKTHLRST